MKLALRIDPADPRPIYVQVIDEIRRGVLRGALRPGELLPSVRELARQLRVNPNTVQQAYRELDREGLIETRRGMGSFVAHGAAADRDARERVLGELAQRALREAARSGLSPDELVRAIRKAAAPPSDEPSHTTRPEASDAAS